MSTDSRRPFGLEENILGGRKRKTADRDVDDRALDDSSRFGRYRGVVEPYDAFGPAEPFASFWPYDYGTRDYPIGYGRGRYADVGYPYTWYPGQRFDRQQASQAIGEAGFDLGISRRAADERRYQQLRDWGRVEVNPNIDDSTLWRPRADVFEQGPDGLRVEFEVPGVPKEDIGLTVKEDIITLTALKPQSRKEEAGYHFQRERHFGKFYRRLALPFQVNPTTARAYLELGVLKVHLWKAESGSRIAISEEANVTIGAPATSGTSHQVAGAAQL